MAKEETPFLHSMKQEMASLLTHNQKQLEHPIIDHIASLTLPNGQFLDKLSEIEFVSKDDVESLFADIVSSDPS